MIAQAPIRKTKKNMGKQKKTDSFAYFGFKLTLFSFVFKCFLLFS